MDPNAAQPQAPQGDRIAESQVRHVARLARLDPSEEEVRAASTQLSAILGYMRRLAAVDVAGVEPLAHPGDIQNRLDADVERPERVLSNEQLMAMAPQTTPPFIRVPKVLDGGGGA